MSEIFKIKSISEYHRMANLPAPDHSLISVIDKSSFFKKFSFDEALLNARFVSELYIVLYKNNVKGSLDYGRTKYDFDEGTLLFMSPGQVFSPPPKEEAVKMKGWILLFHPDLFRNSSLAEKIETYSFFSYEANDLLFQIWNCY